MLDPSDPPKPLSNEEIRELEFTGLHGPLSTEMRARLVTTLTEMPGLRAHIKELAALLKRKL